MTGDNMTNLFKLDEYWGSSPINLAYKGTPPGTNCNTRKSVRTDPPLPTPTNQNQPIAKIFNFCIFHPIWMKFGMGANNGPKRIQIEFEVATVIF